MALFLIIKFGKEMRDHTSTDSTIVVREEGAGEVARMASAEFWHLNREFEGRSLFYGTGIKPIIDSQNRFLALRDAGVIIIFDYSTGACWHATNPWRYEPDFPQLKFHDGFPRLEFRNGGLAIGPRDSRASRMALLPYDSLDRFFELGLGKSKDGFLTHWRPSAGRETNASRRLLAERSVLLPATNGKCEQGADPTA